MTWSSKFLFEEHSSNFLSAGEYTSYILSGLAQPSKSSPRPTGAVAEELAASQGDAKTVMEGDLINLNATSPAASVALGLMYLKSSNRRVADLYFIPGTLSHLNICPVIVSYTLHGDLS